MNIKLLTEYHLELLSLKWAAEACQSMRLSNAILMEITCRGSIVRHMLDMGTLGFHLTHLSRMNFPICISRTSLFQVLGVLAGVFHFYPIFKRKFCKPTVENLIRCGV